MLQPSGTTPGLSKRTGAAGVPMVVGEDGARGLLIGGRRRGLQREVAGEQAGGADQLLGAGFELAHEQAAGEPQLLADLVARRSRGPRPRRRGSTLPG